MLNEIDFEAENNAKISGIICSEMKLSHQVEGEKFYDFLVEVKRLSESKDIIPVTVSEKLVFDLNFKVGDFVDIVGEFRSYNKILDEKSKLVLHVFARDIALSEKKEFVNDVKLTGFLCKNPIYRKTPFNREICDILLAVNRQNYHKSDYIPCILWGRSARYVSGQNIGCKIELYGRIQSREYSKTKADGTVENRVAYEVSVQRLSVLENIARFVGAKAKGEEVVGN